MPIASMDRIHEGVAYAGGASSSVMDNRKASFDRSSPKLQRKRSNPNIRYTTQGPLRSTAGAAALAESANVTPQLPPDFPKQRRGSVRNAVRKLFGRKSRELQQAPVRRLSPPRHGHHTSEPGPLTSSPPAQMMHSTFGNGVRPLTVDPIRVSPSNDFPRIHSPTGGAFPNSGILKPLDLRKPEIRRRKTLPNVTAADFEVGPFSASSPLRAPPIPYSIDALNDASSLKSPSRAKSTKEEKRRSRSADELRWASLARDQSPVRKRSDEIRYWRESFQPDVLRASGFVSPPRPNMIDDAFGFEGIREESANTEVLRSKQSLDAARIAQSGAVLGSSPPRHRAGPSLASNEIGMQSPTSGDFDLGQELEDRVAKLEAGLQTFQRSLQRLTADRNRRTVVVAGESGSGSRRSTDDTRTPSMLADTLQGPFEYSSYEFEYGYNTARPSTSPAQPPRLEPPPAMPIDTRSGSSRNGRDVYTSTSSNYREDTQENDRSRTSRSQSRGAALPRLSTSSPYSQDYTFRSLYQMLADERSARRKLESQLRGLQREITDLSAHVATSTPHFQSQRSSYINPDGTSVMHGTSATIRELLREADIPSSPPTASRSAIPRSHPVQLRDSHSSTGMSTGVAGVVSRFSNSESENGPEEFVEEYDELPTPMDAYRTPKESGSRWTLRDEGRHDAEHEMF